MKLRRIPPRFFHPSVLFLTNQRPAKHGENAFKTLASYTTKFCDQGQPTQACYIVTNAYVDAEGKIEQQPDDDNRRKDAAEFGDTKGLREEEQDKDRARDTNGSSGGDVWRGDFNACTGGQTLINTMPYLP